jgi:Spy/CpxP family protein refolding chaperone
MNNTKTKSLVTIIVFLLITNIAMLIFFLVLAKPIDKRPRNHDMNGMYKTLQNEVGFSQEQLDQYKLLREEQMKNVRPLFKQVRESKKAFYGLVTSDNVADSVVAADADSIAQKQKELDTHMFLYFKNVRKICTPGQTAKFDSVMQKIVGRMVGRPGESRKKPG